jgi:hypothetical protein
VSSTTQPTHVPHYLTRSTSPSYASTTVAVPETTTFELKAAETEPAPGYNEFNENLNNNPEDLKANEEENNEIDLTHTTESPTSDISVTTLKFDKSSGAPLETDEHFSLLSSSNRIRSTKILEENNSGRNMPEMHGESFPWAWAKNILLEKPVMKKTSSQN